MLVGGLVWRTILTGSVCSQVIQTPSTVLIANTHRKDYIYIYIYTLTHTSIHTTIGGLWFASKLGYKSKLCMYAYQVIPQSTVGWTMCMPKEYTCSRLLIVGACFYTHTYIYVYIYICYCTFGCLKIIQKQNKPHETNTPWTTDADDKKEYFSHCRCC